MPTLAIVNFNIVCAVLGGFITLFGLVSYLLKEKFYLSEALISTLAGLVFSPHATNFIKPLQYANNDTIDLETITLYFSRLVLGVQLVLAGVQLPSKYLWTQWKSLSLLLGPGMCLMWISTSLLVWAMVPDINILFALAVGACVTPTDPVLSAGIVKGKFADKNIPPALQKIVVAESGANDGLGYPFLFLALYLIQYTQQNGAGSPGGAGMAMGLWFYETWAYTILMSVAYGAVVGYVAQELLHWAEKHRYVDRESFLVFAIALALFIVGTVGMIGSDDVLACFIAGNAFTWDDWFRLETMDDSLQPTIDMLLNVSIFLWYGAICPWHSFVANNVIPIYRLIPLGIMILLFRRLPMVMAFHKKIPQIEELRHAFFVGFFGPIGVSAIFYLYISREFLRTIEVDGVQRADAARLAEIMDVVIWFLVVCSIVVHGLSIPLGKFGLYLPRTISTALSSERPSRTPSASRAASGRPSPEQSSFGRQIRRRLTSSAIGTGSASEAASSAVSWLPRSLVSVGQHILSDIRRNSDTEDSSAWRGRQSESEGKSSKSPDSDRALPAISEPTNPRLIGHAINNPTALSADNPQHLGDVEGPRVHTQSPAVSRPTTPPPASTPDSTNHPPFGWQRSIRFPDEPSRSVGRGDGAE